MIDPVEGVPHTPVVNQSTSVTKASIHLKPQSAATDIIQISDAAQTALGKASEDLSEVTIKAKCGDLEAQRFLEQEIARKELLGLAQSGD